MNDEQKQLVNQMIDELSILRSGLGSTTEQALARMDNVGKYANELHRSLTDELNLSDANKAAEQSMLEQRDARVQDEEKMADTETPAGYPEPPADPVVIDPPANDPNDPPAPEVPTVPRKSGRKHN